MNNIPKVKLGIIAVSRDCFPITLSEKRRSELVKVYEAAGGEVLEIKKTVESETDAIQALAEASKVGINALIIYLGNFGPEGPETMLAQKFDGPCMYLAAAEEASDTLMVSGRGDAYCGMLNASYNIGIRNLKNVYIPEYPVGDFSELASKMAEFVPVTRVIIGLSKLKVISFGPRPADFVACNAPIKPLYDLGVELQENSELDLFTSFKEHDNDPRIKGVVADMEKELGSGNNHPTVLPKLAQYELTLLDWVKDNKGASEFVTLTAKCWPAFETNFGFVPCYVNSRLASQGIPVACETDIYGSLSEYIITCATEIPATLLDINNTVPYDMYDSEIKGKFDYKCHDVFMGFHCGNTPSCHLINPQLKYQLIMNRLMEDGNEPDITRGTMEGDIKPGHITFFRLQSTADATLTSYVAQGEVLPVATKSFGSIGIFAIKEMARFYRHVLIAKRYPHHGGVAFAHVGKVLFAAMKMLEIDDVAFNQPENMMYKDENPYS
ncbi:MAG: fucose isomerase [Clostridiales bacterium]|nr:fucose isomerase [Clostridiales bacterium]